MAKKEEVDLSPLKSAYEEFFSTVYRKQINELALSYPTVRSLNVDYSELERFNSELAEGLIADPDNHLAASADALSEMKVSMPEAKFEPHVRFFSLPDRGQMIQTISSNHINKLIMLKGVITRRADVGHKVKVALYRCMLCDAEFKVPMIKGAMPPEICESCKRRALKLDEENSYFVDLQRAEAQELLERLKGGEPSSHIELLLEDDIVNTVTPGDTMEITAIVRLRPPFKMKGRPAGQAYTRYLDVIHVKSTQQDFEALDIDDEEKRRIIELSKDPHLATKLISSIAPGIYGHTEVKEAIMLQLFGGTTDKNVEGLGRIRDDIHLLLIGDPGAAKTRFLQYVKTIAPKAIYVSGKSVTGVGLTASAEKDELGDGGWTLKAGALVIASGGIAAVDEFDKIDEEERAALHEVMESQSVSIAKAGIVAQFRAKTAVLAAANPKLGRFDPNKAPGEQFDIPPTLLSRFDLIFPIRDIIDEEKDSKMASHMLGLHKRASQKMAGEKAVAGEENPDIIPPAFLRKYIAYARKSVRPVLGDDAEEKIKSYYVDLRRKGKGSGAVPITPRQIEGLVRMSEACAKMRLSNSVDLEDAEGAIKLMDFVLRQTMMDESGIIDIDRIATGIPKAQRDKINAILGIIKDLQKVNEEVEINAVVTEARKSNINEIDTRRIIDEFLRRGELYKPQHGYVKLVTRYE